MKEALTRLEAAPQPAAQRETLVAAIIGGAQFISMLDATVIMNALPTMARSLNQSPISLNLAITTYLIAAAMFLPVGTWIADRYGARTVFRFAIAGFALSSILCGLAHSLWELVAARAFQGAAGAMMLPVGRLILLKSVPRERLMNALAVLSIPAMLGPVLGQPIGGLIVTFGSWRWIFFLNLPIAALGILLVTLFVPEVKEEHRTPLDWQGFLLAGVSLASLMFGFENIGRGALPWQAIIAFLAIGAIGTWMLVRHTRRVEAPIVDLSLFRFATFRTAATGGLMTRVQIGGVPFLLALMLQVSFGLSPLAAGLITATGAIGSLLVKSVTPPLLRRWGFRTVLIANTALSSLMLLAYATFSAWTPVVWMVLVVFSAGLIRSVQFTSLNAMSYSDVPQSNMSRASSLTAMIQQLAQGFGVGVSALVLHFAARLGGHDQMQISDVRTAFIVLAVLSASALWFFVKLPPHAGAQMSGHRREDVKLQQLEEEAA